MSGNRTLNFAVAFVFSSFLVPSAVRSHELQTSIANCACDTTCYTGSVDAVRCSSDTVQFQSNGLPDPDQTLMTGITASNQQFPRAHYFTFTVPLNPKLAANPTATDAGPIGVAVNGVPLFHPGTQGPVDPKTGQRPHTLDAGELDSCGGHAGRGDDYHYHIAPKCLIDSLGPDHVEVEKRPIGFAMDGFPILALGWFDSANNIEDQLDECRGLHDSDGSYFYNVMSTPKWDILNCIAGTTARGFARDDWQARVDAFGGEIVGIPVPFTIERYELRGADNETCHIMTGTLREEQLLQTSGRVTRIKDQPGTIFYCNPGCYGQFLEADPVRDARGRVLYFERIVDRCPPLLNLESLALFDTYEGPAQSRKGPAGTGR